jgi:hypothetical protein
MTKGCHILQSKGKMEILFFLRRLETSKAGLPLPHMHACLYLFHL